MKLTAIRTVIILFLLIIPATVDSARSQQTMPVENKVELKKFDGSLLEVFRNDDNYQYVKPPERRKNWIMMMWNVFFRWLVTVLGNEGFAWVVLAFLALVGAIGLGFALFGIFGVQKTIPVYLPDRDTLEYLVEKEHINQNNFHDQIERAVLEKNYKKAIRLLYLFTLKIFSDNKLIEWKPSKTNHDYLYELQKESVISGFSKLSSIFEFVWYGDFKAEHVHFEEMNREFLKLNQELRGNA